MINLLLSMEDLENYSLPLVRSAKCTHILLGGIPRKQETNFIPLLSYVFMGSCLSSSPPPFFGRGMRAFPASRARFSSRIRSEKKKIKDKRGKESEKGGGRPDKKHGAFSKLHNFY